MMIVDIIFKKEFFMYKRLLIFALCIIALVSILGLLPIHGESDLYKSVVRLHVLANSDSDADQALKLKVRDAILDEGGYLFKNCTTQAEAQNAITKNLNAIQAIAKNTIAAEGFNYDVKVILKNEEYPTKNYESCCFPSGEYLSLQVLIGDAQGQNWWCVLFPPMCMSAASNGREAFAQVGLTGEQYNVITQTENPKYKVRFKLLEAFGSALN